MSQVINIKLGAGTKRQLPPCHRVCKTSHLLIANRSCSLASLQGMDIPYVRRGKHVNLWFPTTETRQIAFFLSVTHLQELLGRGHGCPQLIKGSDGKLEGSQDRWTLRIRMPRIFEPWSMNVIPCLIKPLNVISAKPNFVWKLFFTDLFTGWLYPGQFSEHRKIKVDCNNKTITKTNIQRKTMNNPLPTAQYKCCC